MRNPISKIAFSILLGLTAMDVALADFEHLPGHFGAFGSSSQYRVAENFYFPQTSSIGSLIWWGGSGAAPPQQDTFVVQLYADAGDRPGALLSGFATGPITRIRTGEHLNDTILDPGMYPEYRYSANLLTPFVAQAQMKYWLSIYTQDGTWAWEVSNGTDLNLGIQRSINGGPWVPYDAPPMENAVAMQLVVVPEPSFAVLFSGVVASWLCIRRRPFSRN